MVQENGACFKDVVAIIRGGVDVLAESAGIERGVVKVADKEGYCVCCRGK